MFYYNIYYIVLKHEKQNKHIYILSYPVPHNKWCCKLGVSVKCITTKMIPVLFCVFRKL